MRLKRPNVSLATQLAVVLVAVVVFSTAVVATVAYDAARRSIREEALQNVIAAAESRTDLLATSLKRRREKAGGAVKNVELGCGISGRMNRVCAREALSELVSEEDARGARLTYGKGRQVVAGDFVAAGDVAPDAPAFLAFDTAGTPIYAVRGKDADTGTVVDIEFPVDELQDLFATDRSMRAAVQMSLLTPDRRNLLGSAKGPVQSAAVASCVAGHDGQGMGVDERGRRVLQAYRFIPQVSGCVLAMVPVDDVLAPAIRLKRRLILLAFGFAVVATGLALIVAHELARPISLLRRRVHSLEKGDWESPVPFEGSTEVQELSRAFQSMADSLNLSRQALIQSEGRLKMTYRAARLWPWEYNVATAEIRWTDPSGSRTLRETVRGFLARVHPDDRSGVQESIERAKREGRYDAEYRLVLPSKDFVWVAGRGQVIYDNAGRPVLMVGVNLDVTARKEAEQALLERERYVATGQMAASLAHEINNPLASVTSALYLMKSRLTESPDARFLEIAAEQTERIARIAKQLLSLYVGTPAAPPVSVTEIWARILKEQGHAASERGIIIQTDLRGSARVHAFGPELRNAFSNMLKNAVQALGSDGTIRLRVRRGRSWRTGEPGVRITLADNGHGIPAEHREEVFRAFYTTDQQPGKGLGLWITQSVVRSLGGTIGLRSSTRQGSSGTCIFIFLPDQSGAVVPKPPLSRPPDVEQQQQAG